MTILTQTGYHIKSEIGNTYGALTVIEFANAKKFNKWLWVCNCSCGNTCNYSGGQLRNGTTTSCGKCKTKGRNPILKSMVVSDNGRVFGRLTVISDNTGKNKYGALMYKCRCECGEIVIVQKQALMTGQTESCGCKWKRGFMSSFNFSKFRSKLSKEEFIYRIGTIHGVCRYSFDNTIYVNSTTKIEVHCNTCGYDFDIQPASMLQGHGCYNCGKIEMEIKLSMSFAEFQRKANDRHDNKYMYDEKSYTRSGEDVSVYCPKHGLFTCIAANHLSKSGSSGCPGCAHFGFSIIKPGLLYYLKINSKSGTLFKIGITNNTLYSRYTSRDRNIIEPLAVKRYLVGKDAYNAEQSILHDPDYVKYKHKWRFKKDVLLSGNTEIFTKNILSINTPSSNEQNLMWNLRGK